MIQKTIADINVQDGRRRVVIERVKPEIDWGGFPIKRLEGKRIAVEADIFVDSHDSLSCLLLCREGDELLWTESPMEPLGNN